MGSNGMSGLVSVTVKVPVGVVRFFRDLARFQGSMTVEEILASEIVESARSVIDAISISYIDPNEFMEKYQITKDC